MSSRKAPTHPDAKRSNTYPVLAPRKCDGHKETSWRSPNAPGSQEKLPISEPLLNERSDATVVRSSVLALHSLWYFAVASELLCIPCH